jgi:predicted  nucleic acid-binding Zn-ribbon protein
MDYQQAKAEIEQTENQLKLLEGKSIRLKQDLLEHAFGDGCWSLPRIKQGKKELEILAQRKKSLERRLQHLRSQPFLMMM